MYQYECSECYEPFKSEIKLDPTFESTICDDCKNGKELFDKENEAED